MKCWICSRQSRGLRHADLRHRPSDPRHYPSDWVFCSRRCQDAFHLLYGNWTRAAQSDLPVGATMVDATPLEQAAMRLCLKFFGEAAGEIGFNKPLGDYSEAQALQVIEAIVTGYTEAMVAHHETTKLPPVRGLPHTPDPMAVSSANPFADMEDDLPWGSTDEQSNAKIKRKK